MLGVLKNGLVLELYDFFIVGLKYQLKSLVMMLHDLAGCPEADIRVVSSYLRSLAGQRKRVKKMKNREKHLQELLEGEFKMIRKRQLKEPDTPRKKKLRESLTIANKELKQAKKVQKNLLAADERRKACEE